MTLDEALAAAVEGARVTAPHMQPGCYVEHSFSRGFLRCWKVNAPNEEPDRTQCDFIAHDGDREVEWRVLEPEEQYPPKPKLTGGWGSLKPATANTPEYIAAVDKLVGAKRAAPPVGDVIDLSAPAQPTWADYKTAEMTGIRPAWLEPRKGGW